MFPPPRDASADFEYARGPLKRYHEEEEAAAAGSIHGATEGFTEHRNKRLHALPLRTSPTARKWALPMEDAGQSRSAPAITPPGSFSEDASNLQQQQQQAFFQQNGPIPTVVQPSDMDMDMMSDDGSTAPPPQPTAGGLLPGSAQPDQESVVANRMPTPIQPSFAAQARGHSWGGAAGNVNMLYHVGTSPSDGSAHHGAALHASAGGSSVPRSLDDHQTAMSDWNMVQNRSLPSPISESGGEEAGTPDMVLDSVALQGQHGHSHGHSHSHSHESHGFDTHGALAAAQPSSPAPMASASSPIRPTVDSDSATTPSPRKGHSRSRHTIVAWTQQPGMKKSFSVGYRADCEKCRNRVPGHFNHIIVS